MSNLHYRLDFDPDKTSKSTTARKGLLKLAELPSLVAKCCKIRKA